MKLSDRYQKVIAYFVENAKDAETELHYSNPFELLVAVILSAQCTDKRVNMVTPALFQCFPTAELMAKANLEEVFDLIKSISFPNNKAKNLIGMANSLVTNYHSEVPNSVDELVKLPGVGRKTANVIVSVVYNQPAMAVDTHVFRVSKRLGLVKNALKTPLEVEKALVKNIPKEYVAIAHHWLILHGRYVCVARKPKCEDCGIAPLCVFYAKSLKNKEEKTI
jgi:endonuclease III